nr:uncharacterized protein LOC126516884 isoform X1 [Dermacentor andersoni]XP_054919753.1 uncharacterized protein LOC126516884 isoform X1 [Dermacentor andersoni]
MLPPGVVPFRLVRVVVFTPRQQALLLLQRSVQHAVRLRHSAAAWLPAALAKSNGLGSNSVARDPRSRHQRCVHQTGAAKPTARSIRQLMRDAPLLRYKERRIEIATCGDLYKKWRAEGRRGYQGAPDTGARVPVVYIHTGLDRIERGDRTERPLCLLLTGAPGQYQGYSYNIPFLDQNGVDVLCFNWPDFAFSLETGYWWHSCDEKTSLLVDFLKKLHIKNIDMLVSHSSGSTPAVQLVAEETEINVKSLALLMPVATRYFRGSRNPLLFNAVVRWAMKSRRGACIVKPFFQAVTSLSKHPTRGRAHDVFFAYHSCIGYEEHRVEKQLATIRHRSMPTLVVFSNNDKVLSDEDNRTLLRRLGSDPERTWLYGSGGHLLRRGGSDIVKAIELKDGSHYGFVRYPDICNEVLIELLDRVRRC